MVPVRTGGVSVQLRGVAIPDNSLVDIGDLLYRAGNDPHPTNANGLHDQTLVCVTDLEDCCESPRTVRGDWYYPDGRVVQFDAPGRTFLKNRGPNEIINGQQFNGSVRLYYRWSGPPGKGRFRCELPGRDNPTINQTLHANIGELHSNYQVAISFIVNYLTQWTLGSIIRSIQWPSLPLALALLERATH